MTLFLGFFKKSQKDGSGLDTFLNIIGLRFYILSYLILITRLTGRVVLAVLCEAECYAKEFFLSLARYSILEQMIQPENPYDG